MLNVITLSDVLLHVANNPFMLGVENNPFMLSGIMLNVVLLSVVAPS